MPDTTDHDQLLRVEALTQTQKLFRAQRTTADVDCLLEAAQKVYEFIRDNIVPLDLTPSHPNAPTTPQESIT